ncbi:MAG: hypothetical protein JSR31_11125 [Nitrospira sp.]|nr:hypothetical protein [Nitrospira sp.]
MRYEPFLLFGSGGASETWLVSDGLVQAWGEYGASMMAAPNRSTHQRLDRKEERPTFYVRAGGAWVGAV